MSDPIFKRIFGDDWEKLPPVMKKHYANRPYQNDKVTVEGVMKVESSLLGKLLTPLFQLAGTLVPYEGENIPATVCFISTPDSDVFQFDRIFHFPGRKPYHFHSRMKPTGGNELVEFMRFTGTVPKCHEGSGHYSHPTNFLIIHFTRRGVAGSQRQRALANRTLTFLKRELVEIVGNMLTTSLALSSLNNKLHALLIIK